MAMIVNLFLNQKLNHDLIIYNHIGQGPKNYSSKILHIVN